MTARTESHVTVSPNKSADHKEVRMFARTLVIVPAIIAVLFAAGVAGAQVLPVRLYGGAANEECHALVEGLGGGFCLAGWTRSFGPTGNSNVLVVKTDPAGIPVWARVSAGKYDEEARAMVRTSNNCYTLAGWTRSYGPGTPNKNIFIEKLDAAGNHLWGRVYGGLADDEVFSIVETADSGYALAGLTHSFGPNPKPNIIVLKLDQWGLLQWMRAYWFTPMHIEDEGYSIVQTPDLGYAVCGRAKAMGPALYNPFLLKLDPVGNIQWVQVAGANYSDEAYSVALDIANNVMVAGRTLSFGTAPGAFQDMFVAKFTLSGVLVWSRTYGWSNGDEEVLDDRSLVGTQDAGAAVCGLTTSVGPGIPNPNFLILKLDPMGIPQWCRSHPSPYHPGLQSDVPLPMIELAAGGYAVGGWTNSFPTLIGGADFMLSTFDPAGNREVCVEPQEPVVMEMPWIQARMTDSMCYPDHDTIFLVPVDVRHDSVCYVETGLDEHDTERGNVGFVLRGSGRNVELTLARPTMVEIQVFTTDGRQVARIAPREYAAGKQLVSIPGYALAGAYVARAIGGGQVASTKIVMF